MYTLVSDQDVINEFNSLKHIVPFGFNIRQTFIEIKNIMIENTGRLYYINYNNEKKSVSSLMKDVFQSIHRIRWLEHLYFIDGFGNQKKFKTHIAEKYNKNFS